MKQTSFKSFILAIFILMFIPATTSAQEKKNEITISGIAAHYDELQVYQWAKYIHGYYIYPVDPGIELLYSRKLSGNLYLGSGLNFQTGKIASYVFGKRRFRFQELSIPLLICLSPKFSDRNGLIFTTGLYGGRLIKVKVEDEGKSENWPVVPMFMVSHFSDDDLFLDIYASMGYYYKFPKSGKLSLTPFIKYRTNSTWLNYYGKKFHYGVKLSYTIEL